MKKFFVLAFLLHCAVHVHAADTSSNTDVWTRLLKMAGQPDQSSEEASKRVFKGLGAMSALPAIKKAAQDTSFQEELLQNAELLAHGKTLLNGLGRLKSMAIDRLLPVLAKIESKHLVAAVQALGVNAEYNQYMESIALERELERERLARLPGIENPFELLVAQARTNSDDQDKVFINNLVAQHAQDGNEVGYKKVFELLPSETQGWAFYKFNSNDYKPNALFSPDVKGFLKQSAERVLATQDPQEKLELLFKMHEALRVSFEGTDEEKSEFYDEISLGAYHTVGQGELEKVMKRNKCFQAKVAEGVAAPRAWLDQQERTAAQEWVTELKANKALSPQKKLDNLAMRFLVQRQNRLNNFSPEIATYVDELAAQDASVKRRDKAFYDRFGLARPWVRKVHGVVSSKPVLYGIPLLFVLSALGRRYYDFHAKIRLARRNLSRAKRDIEEIDSDIILSNKEIALYLASPETSAELRDALVEYRKHQQALVFLRKWSKISSYVQWGSFAGALANACWWYAYLTQKV